MYLCIYVYACISVCNVCMYIYVCMCTTCACMYVALSGSPQHHVTNVWLR